MFTDTAASKVTAAQLAKPALLYLLTELPEGAVQFTGRAVVGVVMVSIRDRQR